MKQYCRYCAYACQISENMCWCEKNNIIMGRKASSHLNKCKDFAFNEIDVFDIEHIYKPRKAKDYNQLSLFENKGKE